QIAEDDVGNVAFLPRRARDRGQLEEQVQHLRHGGENSYVVRVVGTLTQLVAAISAAPASAQMAPLTKAQRAEASQAVAADPSLQKLLSGRKHSVAAAEPWGNSNGSRTVGAFVQVRLATPLNVARVVLPVADFPDNGGTYTLRHVTFGSTFDGKKLTVTTIDYVRHTWTVGSGAIGGRPGL